MDGGSISFVLLSTKYAVLTVGVKSTHLGFDLGIFT
jgi:hypothetical protein